MSKIGILNFHHVYNFGAVLQACALQKVLKSQGHDVENIDYRSRRIMDMYQFDHVPDSFQSGFDEFRKAHIAVSEQCFTDYDELCRSIPEYDAIVIGSDQVWNTWLTDGDPAYFLECVSGKTKKIAYAASFGTGHILPEYVGRFRRMFQDLDFLSVREKWGTKIVRDISGKTAETVLDPTLLFNREQWDDIAGPVRETPSPYILVCVHNPDRLALCVAQSLKQVYRWPVLLVGHTWLHEAILDMDNIRGYDRVIYGTPQEFLEWVGNASYIVTNSFHGTAFSMIYRKPFTATLFGSDQMTSTNSRLYDLLESFGMSDRLVCDERVNVEGMMSCSFDKMENKIESQRNHSLRFLERAMTIPSSIMGEES